MHLARDHLLGTALGLQRIEPEGPLIEGIGERSPLPR
jgi:hypothetical protein